MDLDFPANPRTGDTYTGSTGTVYEWDGVAWIVGFSPAGSLVVMGDILNQIRVLLQDTINESYRYSDISIITNMNMGLIEMFRMRPDIFVGLQFQVPTLPADDFNFPWPLEQQWIPSIVYYAVGMTQMRDDEGTQDQRAASFIQKFTSTLVTPT